VVFFDGKCVRRFRLVSGLLSTSLILSVIRTVIAEITMLQYPSATQV